MRRLILALATVSWAAPVEITPAVIRQGETARIAGPATAVGARVHNRTHRLFPNEAGTFGLLPIPVEEPAGKYTVELLDANNAVVESVTITVRDAHYPTQNVVITNRAVAELKPSPDETEAAAAFSNLVSEVRFWKEPLVAPVPGCMTSRFGVRRFRNGKPTGNYHGGLDLRAHEGHPVRATAAGTVAIARQFALRGGTVGIDHGQGLTSMYLHMSKIAAVEGASVQAGDVIGYAGSTGRSTAPHLHWSINVNGIPVAPLQWVKIGSCGGASASPARPRK